MTIIDELRGYAKALANDASDRADIPLAQCSETMLQAAALIEMADKAIYARPPDNDAFVCDDCANKYYALRHPI